MLQASVPIDPATGVLDALAEMKGGDKVNIAGPFAPFRDKSNTHKKWKRVVVAAAIPSVTFHDLRRTGITRALLDGMPPVVVKELAGHRSLSTTMQYYVEVTKRDIRDAVRNRARSA